MVTMGSTEIKEWLLWGVLRSKNGYYGEYGDQRMVTMASTEIKESLPWGVLRSKNGYYGEF